jgi:hypothetical protein
VLAADPSRVCRADAVGQASNSPWTGSGDPVHVFIIISFIVELKA